MNWTASPAKPGSSSCAWQQSWSSVKSRSGFRPGADFRIASDVWAYRLTAPCTKVGSRTETNYAHRKPRVIELCT